jgi:hypothetical protein
MGKNYGKQFFVNTLGEELRMKWRSSMIGTARCTSRAAGLSLQKTMTSIKVSS